MKITYHKYHAVASWRWDLQPPSESHPRGRDGSDLSDDSELDDDDEEDEEDEDDDDEEDEVCGICQLEFESSCPACKVPGDDCPLMWGQCTHVFHMHCLLKWLNTESSKEQCPLDRRPWVTAERGTSSSHGAPLPTTTDPSLLSTGHTTIDPSRRTTAMASGPSSGSGPDERSMMTIGEESEDVELRLAIEASRAV